MSSGAKRVRVEVCVASPADASVATAGGADRIELNAALELGGLTPSLGSLVETRRATALPIIAMIRPRPGGFCYEAHEFTVMLRDAQLMVQHGADGLAFGILTTDGRVDAERCEELARRVRELRTPLQEGLVFHRAFDFAADRRAALEDLIQLGFRRVMTSGGAASASEGAAEIAKLIRQAKGRIEVLPAGGIRAANVRQVVDRTACDQVHASVRSPRRDPSIEGRPHPSLGPDGDQHFTTDPRVLAELMAAVQ